MVPNEKDLLDLSRSFYLTHEDINIAYGRDALELYLNPNIYLGPNHFNKEIL